MAQSDQIPTERSRVAVLDGLRAIAIILVLMRHGIRPFWTDFDQPFLQLGPIEFGSVFINGWIGVDLFFVLSGYLITDHLLGRYFDPKKRSMDLRTYAKRRFLRIAPAYYFVLTIAVLGLFPFYPYPESFEHIGWRYIYHLLFMQDYWPSDIVVVFWSLAIEIKFYLLAPFLLMGLLRLPKTGQRLAVLSLLFALVVVLRIFTALSNPEIVDYEAFFEDLRSIFHLTLDGLLAGMICAIIYKDQNMRALVKQPRIANTLFFSGLTIFLILEFSGTPLVDTGPSFFDQTFLTAFIAIAFGTMLLGLRGGTCIAHSFFAWKGWFPVALISYSLYLLHLPMMYPAEILTRLFINLDNYSPQVMMLLYWPFFIGLSTAAAIISYCCLEKPFFSGEKSRS